MIRRNIFLLQRGDTMGEIIQFANGEEVASALASANQQVSGMSSSEAWNAMNLHETGKMGVGDYLSQGGNNVINFPNQEAADAFNSYLESGGATSGTGAAASGASKTFQLTSFLKAGIAKAGAILSISLPQAAAAIAPLLGVAIGVGLYELNPSLWEKISRALLPFCWEDTENLPGVVGEDGQVYIDGKVVDAIKQVFDDLNIGGGILTGNKSFYFGSTKKIDPPLYAVPIKAQNVQEEYRDGNYYLVNQVAPPIATAIRSDGTALECYVNLFKAELGLVIDGTFSATDLHNGNVAFPKYVGSIGYLWFETATKKRARAESGTSDSYSYDGKPCYVGSNFSIPAGYTDEKLVVPYSPNAYISGIPYALQWWSLYGDGTIQETYPDGLSKYGGSTPSDYTQNGVDVIKDASGNTDPYYPVYIPIGDPGVTTDPKVNPNPQSPNEFPDLNPLLKPEVSPNQYPSEVPAPEPSKRVNPLPSPAVDPQPSFDPNANPSVRPEPVPSPEPSPTFPIETPEDSPTSSGDSPSTIFPIPNQDWPAIVPTTGNGLIHVYNPTSNEMVAFGNWLWVTYSDKDLYKLWNNPFDGVISAHELYATPQTDGTDSIRSGFLTCPTTAKLVRVRYTTIDCGSIVIPEFYQNYLDYAPYTKAHVYLPFVGIVELDPDDIIGHAVSIKYHVDSYNGSCIAQITVAKSDYSNTIYQFSGNCAVELPLAGGSQASIRAGMIMAAASGITSVVGGIASAAAGSIGGAVGSLVSGAGSVAGHLVSQKSSVQHSGSFGASFGAMGIKKPYIIVRRPIQKEITNYNIEYGFPAHKKVIIGSCTGYLRVLEVHVKSPTATDEEKRAIEKALKNGIFVT